MESTISNYKEKGGAMIILSENNYEAWSSICLDHLLAYPGPWDWIKSGIEPEFEVPPLEIPGPAIRRRIPAARRAEPREGRREAVRGRNRGGRRNRGLADLEDLEEVLGEQAEDEGVGYGQKPHVPRGSWKRGLERVAEG